MERIIIIGGNGCRKTTLAKKLSNKLKLPLIHIDTLYWLDNWQNVHSDEFDRLLIQKITKPKWIIDGNNYRTIPMRLKHCDTVIFMDFPRIRCVYGIIKRVIKNYGKSRFDMGGYCPEKFDKSKTEFIKSVWRFNKKNTKRFYDMLSQNDSVKIIILKSPKQVSAFLQGL